MVRFDRGSNGTWIAKKLWGAGYPTQWHTIQFGDFNGDRKTDLLTRTNDNSLQWQIAFSDGKNFNAQNFAFQNPITYATAAHNYLPDYSDDLLLLSDFNGDGKTDILHGYNRHAYNTGPGALTCNYTMYYSKGDAQFNIIPINSSNQSFGYSYVGGDFNGDGKSDFLTWLTGTTTEFQLVTFRSNSQDGLLHQISDGLGNITEFIHKPLTDYTSNSLYYFYSSQGITPYPLNTISSPIWAVQNVIEPNGIGGLRNKLYSYKNAMFHKGGKGFIGFGTNMYTDISASTITEKNVTFDPLLYIPQNIVSSVSSVLYGVTNLSRETTSFTNTALGSFKRFKHELTNSYTEDLLAGSWVSSSLTYDQYGNVTMSNKNIYNIETENIANSFVPAYVSSTPVQSKLSYTISTKTRLSKPIVSPKTSYTYGINGHVQTRIDWDGLTNAVTTSYNYNTVGLVSSQTISANSVPSRTESFQYDLHNRYATGITNALNETITTGYDPKWGCPISKVGLDGLVYTYSYDGFGRLLQTHLPQGYDLTESLTWSGNSPSGSLYYKSSDAPGRDHTIMYFDALGRQVRTMNIIGISGIYPYLPIFTISDKKYDGKGNLILQSQDHLISETNYMTNSYVYDFLNRTFQSTTPTGWSSYNYSYNNAELTTITTTPYYQYSKTTDATGKIIKTQDGGGTNTYDYDSWGNQQIVHAAGIASTFTPYDDYDRQVLINDADAGITKYWYNPYGELIKQEDARGNVEQLSRDALGRVTTRTGPEGTTNYTFNSAVNGAGDQIANISGFNTGYNLQYNYDNLGKLTSINEMINGSTYTTSYGYDVYGRQISIDYPFGSVQITRQYNPYGKLTDVFYNGTCLWHLNTLNGLGLVTSSTRGNNLTSTTTFQYGLPTNYFTPGVQDYQLSYNLASSKIIIRSDALKGLSEFFNYDGASRLTDATVTTSTVVLPTQTIGYGSATNTNGNIFTKSEVGIYDYKYVPPHAVSYVSNAFGAIPQVNQDVTYTPFSKVEDITEDGWENHFTYGHDYGRRISELLYNGSLQETRLYMGEGSERHINALTGIPRDIYYIEGGDGICAIIYREFNVFNVFYPYSDHLGTIQGITDASGTVVYEQAFDAWGRRRDPNDWSIVSDGQPLPVQWDWLRGFTGHEHMQKFGLINMNGRLYDPLFSRMLSPDNYISDQYNSQAYNRYSYALNNPISNVDPSGNVVGGMFFLSAFLGELGSNVIGGVTNPFGKAYNSAKSASSEVGNIGQLELYNNKYTRITAGIDVFGLGLSANYYYSDGNFSANASVGIGLTSGPNAGAGVSYKSGDLTYAIGGSTNFKSVNIGGGLTYTNGDFSFGYSQTYYSGKHEQWTGGVNIGIGQFRIKEENDFLAYGHESDKYRTQGLEIGYGPLSVGSYIFTNNPLDSKDKDYRFNAASHKWGYNKHGYQSWGEYGQVFSAPLYLGYQDGNSVSRIGISAPGVQDFQQNGVHLYFPPGHQNFYINYNSFQSGAYLYSGYKNNFSLYGF